MRKRTVFLVLSVILVTAIVAFSLVGVLAPIQGSNKNNNSPSLDVLDETALVTSSDGKIDRQLTREEIVLMGWTPLSTSDEIKNFLYSDASGANAVGVLTGDVTYVEDGRKAIDNIFAKGKVFDGNGYTVTLLPSYGGGDWISGHNNSNNDGNKLASLFVGLNRGTLKNTNFIYPQSKEIKLGGKPGPMTIGVITAINEGIIENCSMQYDGIFRFHLDASWESTESYVHMLQMGIYSGINRGVIQNSTLRLGDNSILEGNAKWQGGKNFWGTWTTYGVSYVAVGGVAGKMQRMTTSYYENGDTDRCEINNMTITGGGVINAKHDGGTLGQNNERSLQLAAIAVAANSEWAVSYGKNSETATGSEDPHARMKYGTGSIQGAGSINGLLVEYHGSVKLDGAGGRTTHNGAGGNTPNENWQWTKDTQYLQIVDCCENVNNVSVVGNFTNANLQANGCNHEATGHSGHGPVKVDQISTNGTYNQGTTNVYQNSDGKVIVEMTPNENHIVWNYVRNNVPTNIYSILPDGTNDLRNNAKYVYELTRSSDKITMEVSYGQKGSYGINGENNTSVPYDGSTVAPDFQFLSASGEVFTPAPGSYTVNALRDGVATSNLILPGSYEISIYSGSRDLGIAVLDTLNRIVIFKDDTMVYRKTVTLANISLNMPEDIWYRSFAYNIGIENGIEGAVDGYQYSLNGGSWVNGEGNTLNVLANTDVNGATYRFRAMKNGVAVSNDSEISTLKIDGDAPSITDLSYGGVDLDLWTNNPITMTFKVADALSGVNTVTVNGEPVTFSNGVYSYTMTDYTEYVLKITDNAGNETDSAQYTVKPQIDKIQPDLTVTTDYISGTLSTSTIRFALQGAWGISGGNIRSSIDGGATWSKPMSTTAGENGYTATFIIDYTMKGNVSFKVENGCGNSKTVDFGAVETHIYEAVINVTPSNIVLSQTNKEYDRTNAFLGSISFTGLTGTKDGNPLSTDIIDYVMSMVTFSGNYADSLIGDHSISFTLSVPEDLQDIYMVSYDNSTESFLGSITKRTITFSADNADKDYLADLPQFTYTVGNVLDGDSASAVVSTTADKNSPVGTYDLILSDFVFDSEIYTLGETAKGTLNVNAIAFSGITFEDVSVDYDGNVHSIFIAGAPEGSHVEYSNNEKIDANATGEWYEVSAVVSNPNYITRTYTAKLTIRKINMQGVVMQGALVTYDTNTHSLVVENVPEGSQVTYQNNNQTNVGRYVVIATITNKNYNDFVATATLQITPADFSVTYDDISVAYNPNGEYTHEVSGAIPEGTQIEYNNNIGKDAGEYKTSVTLSNPNYNTLTLQATFTITPIDLTGVVIENVNSVYTGEAFNVAISGYPQDAEVSIEGGNQVNVGKYEVTVTITSKNYNVYTAKGEIIITPAGFNQEDFVFDDEIFEYDGTEKSLTFTGTLPEGSTGVFEGNSAMNAGEYIVTYTIANDNYNTLILNAKITVLPRKVTITYSGESEYFYTGKEIEIYGTYVDVDGNEKTTKLKASREGIESIVKEVGSYQVVFSAEDKNYEASNTDTVTFAIVKTTITITAENQTVIYSGSEVSIVYTLSVEGAVAIVTYNGEQTIAKDAGTYTVVITVEETEMYTGAVKEIELVIEKADFQGITLEDKTVKYNGFMQSLTVDGILPEGTEVAYEGNEGVNVGSYPTTATVKNKNYNDLVLNALFTIENADMQIVFEDAAVTYNGELQMISASGFPENATINYTIGDVAFSGAVDADSYTVTVTVKADNYNDYIKTVTFTINKANFDSSLILFEDLTAAYDGATHTIEYSMQGGAILPDGTEVTYNNNSHIDAGDYTAEVTFTRANYNDLTLTAKLSITPLSFEEGAITFADKTQDYDGTVVNLEAAYPEGATAEYSLNDEVFEGISDAGEYVITVTISMKNYAPYVAQAKLTINKIAYGVTADNFVDKTHQFDGTEAELLLQDFVLPQGTEVIYSNNTGIDAKVYQASVTLKNKNYIDITLNAVLTITPKDVLVTYNGESEVKYTGSEIFITGVYTDVFGNEKTTSLTAKYQGEETVGEILRIGSYTIVFGVDDKNYVASNIETVTFTVSKNTVVITADAVQETTFNGEGQRVNYTLNIAGATAIVTYNGLAELPVNKGTYNVVITVEATADYDGDSVNVTFEIFAATMEGIVFENKTTDYNNTAQSIEISGEVPAGSTIEYRCDNGGANVFTDAGTYTVTVTITNSNYNTYENTAVFVINTIDMNVTYEDASYTYQKDTVRTLIATGYPEGAAVDYKFDESVFEGVQDVGEYEITVTITCKNYNDYTAVKTLVITKADIVGVIFEDKTQTYNGSNFTIEAQNIPEGVTAVYTVNGLEFNGAINVDSYEVTLMLSGKNYNDYIVTATLRIDPASMNDTSFIMNGWKGNYDALKHEIIFEGEIPEGTIVKYTNDFNGAVNAGIYTVEVTLTNPNYIEYKKSATLEILALGVEIIWEGDKNFAYDGLTHSYNAYYRDINGNKVEVGCNALLDGKISEVKNVGEYRLFFDSIQDGNYFDNNSGAVVEISVTRNTLLFDHEALQHVKYNGKPQAVNIVSNIAGIDFLITYNSVKTIPTNADYYKVVISAKSTENYAGATSIVDFYIDRLQYEGLTFEGATFDYDGKAHFIEYNGTIPDFTQVRYHDNVQTEAGRYDVSVSFENINYEDLTLHAVLWIKEAVLEGVTFSDAKLSYNGSAQSIYVANAPQNAVITYIGNDGNINVGNYPVTATVKVPNYQEIELNATLSIVPAKFNNLLFANYTKVFDGKEVVLTVGNLPTGASVEYTSNTATNVGTYKAKAVVRMENYETKTLTATIKITPQPVKVTIVGAEDVSDEEGLKVKVTYTDDNGEKREKIVTEGDGLYKNDDGSYTISIVEDGSNQMFNGTSTLTISDEPATSVGMVAGIAGGGVGVVVIIVGVVVTLLILKKKKKTA